jgi:hypothetical protein
MREGCSIFRTRIVAAGQRQYEKLDQSMLDNSKAMTFNGLVKGRDYVGFLVDAP